MKKVTIAIDGYSSCGKSTIAKAIAKKMSYNYVDSGAMYRSVTLYLMEQGILKDGNYLKNQVLKALSNINISFQFNEKNGNSDTYLNGTNVEDKIRSMEVSRLVSQISTISEVRSKLVEIQQELGRYGGVVMDGRDIGTVVFPNADLKLFMTAEVDIRTERRLNEISLTQPKLTFDDVKLNLTTRDKIDTTRDISPLTQADDAVVIDNSHLTQEEQLDVVLELINQRVLELN